MNYISTIGLEIHCELKTQSKMFCGCPNNPDETRANFNVCPICLGHPGTLPVINQEAVMAVLKLGLALGGNPPTGGSRFDRKSYFYPDLPKGYQISQYQQPLAKGGNLLGVKITRIHLEEDTGTLAHSKENYSLVDFNRAGIPLMELVTDPDIKSAEQAAAFAKELQLILRYLEISDADMEKGQLRIEVNISLSQNDKLGTKVEIKNLNSFKAVQEAINYEIKRQTENLERGEKIIQETRGWDDVKKITVSQRTKEESHDYRYFPEPDLPPLELSRFNLDNLPELPDEKRKRFKKEYNLTPAQAEILIGDKELADYFEKAASKLKENNLETPNYQILFNYLTSDLRGLMKQNGVNFNDLKINPEDLAHLVILIESYISSWTAKDILSRMFKTGDKPQTLFNAELFTQVLDKKDLMATVQEIIKENPKAVGDYKKGKANTLQFMIGQAMKKLKGKGNPDILRKLFEDFLSK